MKTALVVTTISPPNHILRQLTEAAGVANWDFHIVGDRKSPAAFELDGARYYDLAAQRAQPLRLAKICPEASYTRKNLGYLLAIQNGCDTIIETDDDNYPIAGFTARRERFVQARTPAASSWVNVYGYFGQQDVWPRGLPLDAVLDALPALAPSALLDCPIQQGLADANPDVDAVYRLVRPLPIYFDQAESIALGNRAWCPFNSQNTTWFRQAFPLMYLPATCSFRMTDIWRSFVAQRVAWAQGWNILFHAPTVAQERNDHSLMRDFEDEVSGYLNNRKIGARLDSVAMTGNLAEDLLRCHQALVEMGLTKPAELDLLDAWLADLTDLGVSTGTGTEAAALSPLSRAIEEPAKRSAPVPVPAGR